MALPPLIGNVYAVLGGETWYNYRPGTYPIVSDEQFTNLPSDDQPLPPKQQIFFSYQWYFKDYPSELIVITPDYPLFGPVHTRLETANYYDFENTYPNNLVTQYSPLEECGVDPDPNPNGDIGRFQIDEHDITWNGYFAIFPRWHTDTPYDFSSETFFYTPQPGDYYEAYAGIPYEMTGEPKAMTSAWTYNLSMPSPESPVVNLCTSETDSFPTAQPTIEVRNQAKFRINPSGFFCCWNEGTILRGKVAFKSVNVMDYAPLGLGTSSWGISFTIGGDFAAAGEADWEITLTADFEMEGVEIPLVAEQITFINDFWVTEVIPPGG